MVQKNSRSKIHNELENNKLNKLNHFKKKANVIIIQVWINIKCLLGFHKYVKKKRYSTYLGDLDKRKINRRAKAELHICKNCGKEKIIIDVKNSYL